MSDTSGPMWRTPLAHYDPDGSSGRMWQVTCLWGLMTFSDPLPRWGMTRGSELFELPTPARLTSGHGSSSLLPTPDTGESLTGHGRRGGRAGNGHQSGQSLDQMVTLLPTPVTAYSQRTPEEWRAGRPAGTGRQRDLIGDLEIVVKLFPTPKANEANGVGVHGIGGQDLRTAISLLPTPQAHDSAGQKTPEQVADMRKRGHGVSNLNEVIPHLFQTSNGDPTHLPSPDGNSASAGQLPGQLSLDAMDPD